jgi:hypothetical protein
MSSNSKNIYIFYMGNGALEQCKTIIKLEYKNQKPTSLLDLILNDLVHEIEGMG